MLCNPVKTPWSILILGRVLHPSCPLGIFTIGSEQTTAACKYPLSKPSSAYTTPMWCPMETIYIYIYIYLHMVFKC